jgi:hypothetical protein
VNQLAEFWRENGLEVVYLYGADRFVPADLVLVHVDPSVVPEEYLEFAAQYLNRTPSGNRVKGVRDGVAS